MNDVVRYLQEGGWSMYPIACFGVIGVFMGLAALASMFASSRKMAIGLGISALLLGLMALGMGLVGTMQGRRTTEEAIVNVDPEFAEVIRVQGYEESDNNLVLGALACALPLLAGLLAVGRGLTMKEPEKR